MLHKRAPTRQAEIRATEKLNIWCSRTCRCFLEDEKFNSFQRVDLQNTDEENVRLGTYEWPLDLTILRGHTQHIWKNVRQPDAGKHRLRQQAYIVQTWCDMWTESGTLRWENHGVVYYAFSTRQRFGICEQSRSRSAAYLGDAPWFHSHSPRRLYFFFDVSIIWFIE